MVIRIFIFFDILLIYVLILFCFLLVFFLDILNSFSKGRGLCLVLL